MLDVSLFVVNLFLTLIYGCDKFTLDIYAVNGGWSSWGSWGRCGKTCGGGTQLRSRQCTRPPPRHNGKPCIGRGVQSRSCNVYSCPPGMLEFSRFIQSSNYGNLLLGQTVPMTMTIKCIVHIYIVVISCVQ